ncbi:extracellular solute-binding protein [uncultured Ruegeria sp.]|uniref:extracellular solute-binding protein n=1 Tax=uncultured Ruegeria sp. TaxID=259304 RepID=UPI0026149B6D|nr:extracellular solute-binding protein [uncultured Ruegeria sp.]
MALTKTLAKWGGAAALLLASTTLATADNRQVYLFNWSDYIDETALEMFEAETGIEVVYDTFDSSEFMEAKLLAGNAGYDVVVPSSIATVTLHEAGVIVPLDRSKLTNWDNLWDEILTRVEPYDPGNQLMVPYAFWTFGIVVNEAMVQERLGADYPKSWSLIFDPEYAGKLQDCGIHLVDSGSEFIAMALQYLGLNPNSEDPAELEQAIELLVGMSPSISKVSGDGLETNMANGDTCLGVTWSGDALSAKGAAEEAENGVELNFFVPEEGSSFDFEGFTVTADAANPEEAHAFINFMMRPDIAALNANYVRYGSPNIAAKDLVDEELLNDPTVYPPAEAFENLFTYSVRSLKTERIITRGWTRVVTGQ